VKGQGHEFDRTTGYMALIDGQIIARLSNILFIYSTFPAWARLKFCWPPSHKWDIKCATAVWYSFVCKATVHDR